jgi:hypothetical protein
VRWFDSGRGHLQSLYSSRFSSFSEPARASRHFLNSCFLNPRGTFRPSSVTLTEVADRATFPASVAAIHRRPNISNRDAQHRKPGLLPGSPDLRDASLEDSDNGVCAPRARPRDRLPTRPPRRDRTGQGSIPSARSEPGWSGRMAVLLFGIDIGGLDFAAVPPVVAEVEDISVRGSHSETQRGERHTRCCRKPPAQPRPPSM